MFPWHPPAVANLKNGPGSINEVPTVIALCETNTAEEQKSTEEALTAVAEVYIEKQKAAGEEDPEFKFMIATTSSGISPQLRKIMSLPALNPVEHEHESEEKEAAGNSGCGQQQDPLPIKLMLV